MAVLGHLRIAEQKQLIPVVDMMNYKNTYLDSDKLGKINSWEYYFTQPNKISLLEAYKSNNVILSNMETPFEANPRSFYEKVFCNNGKIDFYYKLVNDYIKYENKTEKILNDNYNKILKPVLEDNNKVLGIVIRGTDIINFPGHSIQPTLEETFEYVKKLMKDYRCDYIFVASDSNKSINYFKEKLGEKYVLTNDCMRYDNFSNSGCHVLSEMKFNRENDNYLKGIEYLTSVFLLSKCNVLFGSIIGSTIGAICMNNGNYEHIEIFDKGTY